MFKFVLVHILAFFALSSQVLSQCGPSFIPLNLGNDTTLCQGQSLTIGATSTYDTYLWNTGNMNPTITVTNPGTYTLNVSTLEQNLVVNGDFSQGNTGFTSNYVYGTGGAWGLLSNEGQYAIAANANQTHNNFANCWDNTVGNNTGSMMVVNGSSVPNAVIWQQTITVTPNTNYQFSAWGASVVSSNPGVLRFMINGVQVGAQLNLSPQLCNWQQFFVNWNSGANTTINIAIINQNVSNDGNDFAIDDISFRPLCTSSDNITIAVEPVPTANLGSDLTLCEGENITLGTTLNGDSYLWNTGETSQTIEVDVSGDYSVSVFSPSGCFASDEITVTFETPANAGLDGQLSFCNTENQINLTDYLENGVSQNGSWSSGNAQLTGLLSSAGNLQINNLGGNYAVSYVVPGVFCPNDMANWNITISRQPLAGTDAQIHICNSTEYSMMLYPELNFIEAAQGGYWIQNLSAGNAFNPTNGALAAEQISAGNYTFSYVMEGAGACVNDTANVQVWVSAMPINQFSSDVTSGCEALTVSFINEPIASENTTYQYQLSDGNTYNNVFNFNHVFQNAGCYDIILTAVSDGLCVTTQVYEDMICVDPLPVASFSYSPNPVFADNPEVVFSNNSIYNATNFWDFGDGQTSTFANPNHNYATGIAQNYTVTLIVISDAGCSDTTTQIVEVNEQLLFYVPNTFTPDGDLFNPVFLPIMTTGFDPYDYHLSIFNRWGELVFESRHPKKGWDGTYAGSGASEGVYIWTLRFGDEYNDNVYYYQGHLNLLR